MTFVVLEHALRTRFLKFYNGVLPVEHEAGNPSEIQVRNFEEVNDGFRRGSGVHAKDGWKLRSEVTRRRHDMPLTLAPLLEWARRERLLDGQRAKRHEHHQSRFRNWFVHGNQPLSGMPNESTRRINDLAETINRLWGARTPSGRLYPAPITRDVVALAWSNDEDRRSWAQMYSTELGPFVEAEGVDWTFLLVRAVPTDGDLLDFDTQYERTRFPTERLWGPGTGLDALSWWRENQPAPDTVQHIDRVFLIRVDGGRIYFPRRPGVALALPREKRLGTWHIIRADFPKMHGYMSVISEMGGAKQHPNDADVRLTRLLQVRGLRSSPISLGRQAACRTKSQFACHHGSPFQIRSASTDSLCQRAFAHTADSRAAANYRPTA